MNQLSVINWLFVDHPSTFIADLSMNKTRAITSAAIFHVYVSLYSIVLLTSSSASKYRTLVAVCSPLQFQRNCLLGTHLVRCSPYCAEEKQVPLCF